MSPLAAPFLSTCTVPSRSPSFECLCKSGGIARQSLPFSKVISWRLSRNLYGIVWQSPFHCFMILMMWQDHWWGMGWQLGTSCISDGPRWRMQCAYEGWNARGKSAYYRFRLYAFAMNLEEARLVLSLKTTRNHAPEVGSFFTNPKLSKS